MLEVHFEAKFDRHQARVGAMAAEPVVVKRSSFTLHDVTLVEELSAAEGQKIFAADVEALHGCNHRIEVIALKLQGALFKPAHPIKVGVKMGESA